MKRLVSTGTPEDHLADVEPSSLPQEIAHDLPKLVCQDCLFVVQCDLQTSIAHLPDAHERSGDLGDLKHRVGVRVANGQVQRLLALIWQSMPITHNAVVASSARLGFLNAVSGSVTI